MFDKFCDYMYYLLTSPFKRVKKALNQWYILFQVLGRRFDDAMESIYSAREQTMLATCNPEMLPVHAADRKMKRYVGEMDENFRIRIANFVQIQKLGGSDDGVLLAVRTLGFDDVSIIKAKILKQDAERWAEFYVIIRIDPDGELPVGYDILKKQVRRVKYVTALDDYQIILPLHIKNINQDIARCIIKDESGIGNEQALIPVIRCKAEAEMQSGLHLHLNIKNDLWYFDGTYFMNGIKKLDAYERWEEL